MKGDANKALVRRFVAEVFEGLRTEAVDELVADDFTSHTWGSGKGDKAYLEQATVRVRQALTDVSFVVDDLIAEDDRVAARLTSSGKHDGVSYSIGEIHIFRIRDGMIVEHWHQYDEAGMQRQLGMPS